MKLVIFLSALLLAVAAETTTEDLAETTTVSSQEVPYNVYDYLAQFNPYYQWYMQQLAQIEPLNNQVTTEMSPEYVAYQQYLQYLQLYELYPFIIQTYYPELVKYYQTEYQKGTVKPE